MNATGRERGERFSIEIGVDVFRLLEESTVVKVESMYTCFVRSCKDGDQLAGVADYRRRCQGAGAAELAAVPVAAGAAAAGGQLRGPRAAAGAGC